MNWMTSPKKYEFVISPQHRERLLESILETGDPPTALSKIDWIGHRPINLFGMPGVIFPHGDIRFSGRLVVKTGSMIENPKALEFNYGFSGSKLQLWGFQTWGEIEIEDVIQEIQLFL